MTERVFRFPVCCGRDIHIVSLYENLSIAQTTHENDPDVWLQETISDLTGDPPPCDEFVKMLKIKLETFHVSGLSAYDSYYEWGFPNCLIQLYINTMAHYFPVRPYDLLGVLSKTTREALYTLNIHLDSTYVRYAMKVLDVVDSSLRFYEKLDTLPGNAVSAQELDMAIFSSLRGAEERLSKWAGKVAPSTYETAQDDSEGYFVGWMYNRIGHAVSYLKRYVELTLGRQIDHDRARLLREFFTALSSAMSQHRCLEIHDYPYPLSREDLFVVEADGEIYGRKWVLENLIKQNDLFLTRTPPELFLARCDRNRP
jgi:hypothetical protein